MIRLAKVFVGADVTVARCTTAFRDLHLTTVSKTSVFMKKQKKIDPELAKIRENRKRKKLEREIRLMQKHSKKPKPVDEMTIDIKSAKNIHERYRLPVELTEAEIDERAVTAKEYSASRSALMQLDDAWIRESIRKQEKALRELKKLSPELYAAAVQPDLGMSEKIVLHGPAATPPLPQYDSPDGDYIDTTRSWA